jgi:hypothetical protein
MPAPGVAATSVLNVDWLTHRIFAVEQAVSAALSPRGAHRNGCAPCSSGRRLPPDLFLGAAAAVRL